MPSKIIIHSSFFSNDELKNELETAWSIRIGGAPTRPTGSGSEGSQSPGGGIGDEGANSPVFELHSKPPGTRSLDPTILSAIIEGSAAIIGAFVGGLITYLVAVHGKRKDAEAALITIKGGGKEISFPANLPKEQLAEYIAMAKQWDQKVEEIQVKKQPKDA